MGMRSNVPAPDAWDQFYDSADKTPPTFGQSVFNSIAAPIFSSRQALNALGITHDQGITDLFNTIQAENAKENQLVNGKEYAKRMVPDFIAGAVGTVMDPLAMGATTVGGELAAPVLKFAAGALGFAPEALNYMARIPLKAFQEVGIAEYLPKTVGEAVSKHVAAGGAFAGQAIPTAIADNYEQDTKHIRWGGVAREAGENGAIGLAMPIVGYTLGAVWKKAFGRNAKVPLPGTEEAVQASSKLDTALKNGDITPEQHQWYQDYLKDPLDPTLADRATKILDPEKHKINAATKEAVINFAEPQDVNGLKNVIPEQLSHAEAGKDNTANSEFIVGHRFDELRENPDVLDGLEGFIETTEHKLDGFGINSELPKKLAEADKILDEYLTKGTEEKMVFSQEELLNHLRDKNFDVKESKNLPITIPESIINVIKNDKKNFIEYLKNIETEKKFTRLSTESDIANHEFYHGSGGLHNIKDFDITRAAKDSLYGVGLYLTDNKRVATGYARNRQIINSKENTSAIIGMKFKKQPKLIDVERAPEKDVFNIMKKTIGNQDDIELENELSKSKIDDIFKIIKRRLKEKYVDPLVTKEAYMNFLNNLNNHLEEKDYDGYLHTGGNIVGGGRQHNVIVLFGHEYNFKGEKIVRNPAAKLEQHAIDMYHDFTNKIQTFHNLTHDKSTIDRLESQNKKLLVKYGDTGNKRYFDQVRSNDARIKELQSGFVKHQSPKDELINLRQTLLGKGRLSKNYKTSSTYQRLSELADVWHNAKTLLDRVHLQQDYERQEAFMKVAKNASTILNSNIDQFADQSRVVNYLKDKIDRLAGNRNEPGFKPELKPIPEAAEKIPESEHAEMLKDFESNVNQVAEENLKNEFYESKKRYDQFKAALEKLPDMIDCLGRE